MNVLSEKCFPKENLSRVAWLQNSLCIEDAFFGKMLQTSERDFVQWKNKLISLSEEKIQMLEEFWDIMTHLRRLAHNDTATLQHFFEHAANPGHIPYASPSTPWAGESLKRYLETQGKKGLDDVNRWVFSLKFH